MNHQDIVTYNNKQSADLQPICEVFEEEISAALPEATAKLFHGSPVWFLDENPIVGYDASPAGHVNLLFWSGQSFDEPLLTPRGKYKAAGTSYTAVGDVDAELLHRWLAKARTVQWDYKNLRQNNGELHRLV